MNSWKDHLIVTTTVKGRHYNYLTEETMATQDKDEASQLYPQMEEQGCGGGRQGQTVRRQKD